MNTLTALRSRIILLFLLFGFIGGCSNTSIFKPFFITLDQGNIFTQEQVDAIELGMSSRQVRFLLGTPTVVDTFNPNRWDYFYTITEKNELSIKQHLTILFDEDRVVEIKPIIIEPANS